MACRASRHSHGAVTAQCAGLRQIQPGCPGRGVPRALAVVPISGPLASLWRSAFRCPAGAGSRWPAGTRGNEKLKALKINFSFAPGGGGGGGHHPGHGIYNQRQNALFQLRKSNVLFNLSNFQN